MILIIIEELYSRYKGIIINRNADMISSLSSGITNLTKDVLKFSIVLISYPWLVDNIMIYSDVLTTDEIELLYNNDNTLNDNIVGYWNCNTGSGDILYDQSGNQNNGTISGALWSTNSTVKRIYISTLV